jgi:outer membrane autotransporter protein
VNDVKTVTVDGLDLTTGMGGTRVELGAGFTADMSDTAKVWGQVKGAYAEGESVLGYQGQAGMHISW